MNVLTHVLMSWLWHSGLVGTKQGWTTPSRVSVKTWMTRVWSSIVQKEGSLENCVICLGNFRHYWVSSGTCGRKQSPAGRWARCQERKLNHQATEGDMQQQLQTPLGMVLLSTLKSPVSLVKGLGLLSALLWGISSVNETSAHHGWVNTTAIFLLAVTEYRSTQNKLQEEGVVWAYDSRAQYIMARRHEQEREAAGHAVSTVSKQEGVNTGAHQDSSFSQFRLHSSWARGSSSRVAGTMAAKTNSRQT